MSCHAELFRLTSALEMSCFFIDSRLRLITGRVVVSSMFGHRESLILTLGLCALVSGVHAQFKCTSTSGAVSFQQTPCSGTDRRSERLDIRPAAGATATGAVAAQPASATSVGKENADMRMARQMERERLIREKEFEIAQLGELMARRTGLMEQELAALRIKKMQANNNLAGATWEQSISTEMSVVVEKYKVQKEADGERLKVMSAELRRLKEATR